MSFSGPAIHQIGSAPIIIRGPFPPTEDPATPSSFTPSGAEWTAAAAVYASMGVDGHIWIADPSSLRASDNTSDGVESGQQVGYANDWLSVGNNDRAARESGDRRPTYAVVDGVPAWVLTGDQTTTDNQRLALPIMDPSQGTWITVGRMANATNANQTLFECGPARSMAQMTGFTGPTVRVGSGTQYQVGLSSMLERWTCLIIQADKIANRLRYIYDGASAWAEQTVTDWLDAPPAIGYEQENYIGRNYFDGAAPFGAPMNGAVHAVIYIAGIPTQAQLQDLLDLALRGTAVSFAVPDYPGDGGGEPGDEGTYTNTINVSDASQLANALSAAGPGDDIVLANGTYSSNFTLSANGTAANRIRVRAATIGGATIAGTFTQSGNYTVTRGLKFTDRTASGQIHLVSGSNQIVERCYYIRINVGASGSVDRAALGVAASAKSYIIRYNHFEDCTGYSSLKLRTASSNQASGGLVERNYFFNHSNCQAFSAGGNGTRAGTDRVMDCTVRYNYFENCKNGIGICYQIKTSSVTTEQNTFKNCGWIFNRHGKNCIWRSNTLGNSGGPNVCGDNHQIIGNLNETGGRWGSPNSFALPAPGAYSSIGGCRGSAVDNDAFDPTLSNNPRAVSCLFAGNNGPLSFNLWPISANIHYPIDCIIEAHIGSVTESNAVNLTYRALTVNVPARIEMSAATTGPLA